MIGSVHRRWVAGAGCLALFWNALPASAGQTPSPAPVASPTSNTTPDIVVETAAPVATAAGRVIEHTIRVRNGGAAAADSVEIRGRFTVLCELQGAEPECRVDKSALVWSLGRMEPGETRELITRVRALAAGKFQCVAKASFGTAVPPKVEVPLSKLNIQIHAPSDLRVGQSGRAVITVMNNDARPIEHARLRQVKPGSARMPNGPEEVPSGFSVDLGTLEPGAIRTIESEMASQIAGAMQFSLALETAEGIQAHATATVQVRQAKLAVSVLGPATRHVGRPGNYQLIVMNKGNAIAESVEIIAAIPAGMEVLEINADGVVDAEKRTVSWKIGSIPGGEGRGVAVVMRPTTSGEHLLRTVVSAATDDLLVKSDAILSVNDAAAPTIQVVNPAEPIEIGSNVRYEIHVANRGNKPAEAVEVVGTLPEGMEYLSANGPTTHRVEGQQVTFAPIAHLDATAAVVYSIDAAAKQTGTGSLQAKLMSASIPAAVRSGAHNPADTASASDDAAGTRK